MKRPGGTNCLGTPLKEGLCKPQHTNVDFWFPSVPDHSNAHVGDSSGLLHNHHIGPDLRRVSRTLFLDPVVLLEYTLALLQEHLEGFREKVVTCLQFNLYVTDLWKKKRKNNKHLLELWGPDSRPRNDGKGKKKKN